MVMSMAFSPALLSQSKFSTVDTGDLSTTSTDPVEISGIPFTITTTGGTILLWAGATAANDTAGGRVGFQLWIDNIRVDANIQAFQVTSSAANEIQTGGIFYLEEPAAGSRKYEMRWFQAAGVTATSTTLSLLQRGQTLVSVRHLDPQPLVGMLFILKSSKAKEQPENVAGRNNIDP